MQPIYTASPKPVELMGTPIPGAEDRHQLIPGFDQRVFSRSHVLCIGAGGLMSNVAPTLVRKGVGAVTLLDDDVVETSNLNRQRFYPRDIGSYKAVALAQNLRPDCIAATRIRGIPLRLEEAIACGMNLSCDLAVCGVDNNPARVAASRHFRAAGVPVLFCAVSTNGDHGYVFVQDKTGPCIACLFPDIVNDDRYPCPGTPAIADILQAVGALTVYAIDTCVMGRTRHWNYRKISFSNQTWDAGTTIDRRPDCPQCAAAERT